MAIFRRRQQSNTGAETRAAKAAGPTGLDEVEEACSSASPASVISPTAGWALQCRFDSLIEGGLLLYILEGDLNAILPASTICVSFVLGCRGHVFMTTVRAVLSGDDQEFPKLLLARPDEVARTELRRSFRVPLLSGHTLTVKVTDEQERRFAVTPNNISLGGIAIERPDELEPTDWPVGNTLKVDLSMGDLSIGFAGDVRRVDGSQIGLFFPETMSGDSLTPPLIYRKMISALERQWLRLRAA